MGEENWEPAKSEIREVDLGQPVQRSRRLLVYRHARITRLTHWINLLCVTALLMSGLQIFMAHPALYWGQFGADGDWPAFEIGSKAAAQDAVTRRASASVVP
jgi:Prokaryotic cytochrome b561